MVLFCFGHNLEKYRSFLSRTEAEQYDSAYKREAGIGNVRSARVRKESNRFTLLEQPDDFCASTLFLCS
jgi:hypothetical protein